MTNWDIPKAMSEKKIREVTVERGELQSHVGKANGGGLLELCSKKTDSQNSENRESPGPKKKGKSKQATSS